MFQVARQAPILICLLLVFQWAKADDAIGHYLAARDFAQAVRAAESSGDDRDRLLGRVALAQASLGDAAGSKSTLRKIVDATTMYSTAREVRARSAAGGATGADFDSLINLITSTVAPNSWDDVGGPGAIVEFPGGVSVDAGGLLRRSSSQPLRPREDIGLVRQTARHVAANTNARRASKLRMVSLSRLQRELQLQAAFGESPTEAMKHLAGLKEVRYLFLFPEKNDCVLAGPAGDWAQDAPGQTRPALLLDDFVTLLRNARQAGGRFGCSINPKRENLLATKQFLATPTGPLSPRQTVRWVERIRDELGLQDILIQGVAPESHVARVLIEADYHMKLVGMGLEPSVPGVPPYLESIEPDELPTSMDVLRWWFTMRSQTVERNAAGNAFLFLPHPVQLKCENELVSNAGERIQTGDSSALNQMFASRFTNHFGRFTKRYPVYARLEGLFKLALVTTLLQADEVRSKVDFDPGWMIDSVMTGQGKVPKEVASIVNHRVVDRRHIVVGVSGGVSVDAGKAIKTIPIASDAGSLESNAQVAEPRDAWSSARWWWDEAGGEQP